MSRPELRPVEWVGSSKEDVKAFPARVQDHVGFALYQAQAGLKHRDGDTYRAVYTVRFEAAVYVLHAFQKKAKRGRATPKHEIELIERRLKVAEQHYEATYGKG